MRLMTLVYLRRGTNTLTSGRCQFVSYNEAAQTLAGFSDVSSDSNERGHRRHTRLRQLPVESRDEGTYEWDETWDKICQWPDIYIYMILTVNCVYISSTECVLFMWLFIFYSTYILSDSRQTDTVLLPPGGLTQRSFNCWQYFALISTPIFQHLKILKNIKLYFIF